jgi:alpha-1,2-mannosyltransferase
VLLGAILLVAAQVAVLALWPAAHTLMIDLQVYVAGGAHLLAGQPLYEGGVLLDLPFVYPPIAAVLFVPLSLVPLPVLKIAWTLLNVVLLALVVRRCAPGAPVPLVTLLTAAALWLDPVRTTLYLGQINVVLLALVLLDLTGKRRGYALGLAAAVKLTPLLFVAYLLLKRDFRAAARATATFAVLTGLGFLLAPADSVQYWLRGTVIAADRISAVAGPSNHALAGTLGRLGLPTLLGLLLAGVTLLVARRLASPTDRDLAALTVVGLGSAAAAPFAWSHHYVWCVPLLVLLVVRLRRGVVPPAPLPRWIGVAATLLVTAAVITKLPGPDVGPIPATGLISLWPDAYVVGFLALLLTAGRLLAPSTPPHSVSRTGPST